MGVMFASQFDIPLFCCFQADFIYAFIPIYDHKELSKALEVSKQIYIT